MHKTTNALWLFPVVLNFTNLVITFSLSVFKFAIIWKFLQLGTVIFYIWLRCIWVGATVFNITFNNISAILWRTFLLVEKTRVSGENHRHVAGHWQTIYLSHNAVSSTPHLRGIRTQNISSSIWQRLNL